MRKRLPRYLLTFSQVLSICVCMCACSSAPVTNGQPNFENKQQDRDRDKDKDKDKDQISEQLVQDLKDEQDVGRQMAAKLAGTMGVFDSDEKLTRYLNLVGRTVAERANRPEISYHFALLKTEDINAFATPGGYVFVTMGLLHLLASESELAGILGHEIAHITEKHMYKEIMPKRNISAGETITRILSRGRSDLGFSIGKIVNNGLAILLEKGLGPEKEQEADSDGIMFASAAGYEPLALEQFLKRLAARSTPDKLSKTHPPFPERLRVLHEFILKNGLNQVKFKFDTVAMQKRFTDVMGRYHHEL